MLEQLTLPQPIVDDDRSETEERDDRLWAIEWAARIELIHVLKNKAREIEDAK